MTKGTIHSIQPAAVFHAGLGATRGGTQNQLSCRWCGCYSPAPSVLPHRRFPAPSRKDTLSWDRPVLDEDAGNIIDFTGSVMMTSWEWMKSETAARDAARDL